MKTTADVMAQIFGVGFKTEAEYDRTVLWQHWTRGRAAALAGKPMTGNPCTTEPERTAWDRGYLFATREAGPIAIEALPAPEGA